MNILEAFEEGIKGKVLARKHWLEHDSYFYGCEMIVSSAGRVYPYHEGGCQIVLTKEDLAADDWVAIEKPIK